jgi:hypothetical protein
MVRGSSCGGMDDELKVVIAWWVVMIGMGILLWAFKQGWI